MSFKKPLIKRAIAVLVAVLLSLPIVFTVSAGNTSEPMGTASETTVMGELADGVYRIKNLETGLYLETYKYSAKGKEKLCASELDVKNEGQCFYVRRAENGSWILSAQNENGEYSLSWQDGTAVGDHIVKTQKAADAEYTYFDISRLDGGAFTIAPAGGDNYTAVLATVDEKTYYSDKCVRIADLAQGDKTQMWMFERVPTDYLTTAYEKTTVKLYSTGKFYARKYPYSMVTSDIVWTSSDEDIIMMGADGVWCALGKGVATVTASVDAAVVSFQVTVEDKAAFTWYSQTNMYTSDWSARELESLYFVADGSKKRFAWDVKRSPSHSSWMESGCALASSAMVLNNMGAVKTTGYDLRTGQEGSLIADPYTVALANSGNHGVNNTSKSMYGNPIYMYWSRVASKFNVDGENIEYRRHYVSSKKKIKDLLTKYPQGVIVLFKRSNRTHYIVFAECLNPEETVASKIEFLVYDPAAYKPENGDGVPFQKTVSYLYEGFRYSSIANVTVYDVESKLN
jgi:hypothetical protein